MCKSRNHETDIVAIKFDNNKVIKLILITLCLLSKYVMQNK